MLLRLRTSIRQYSGCVATDMCYAVVESIFLEYQVGYSKPSAPQRIRRELVWGLQQSGFGYRSSIMPKGASNSPLGHALLLLPIEYVTATSQACFGRREEHGPDSRHYSKLMMLIGGQS